MRKEHLEKVCRNMEAAGLSQIVVTSPISIFYLTGRLIHPGERLVALIVKANGDVRLIANRLFAQRPLEGASLIEYSDTDDSAQVLSSAADSGVLGVDKDLTCRFLLPLMDLRRDLRFVNGSPCVDRARMLKTEAELAVMAESSRINDEALKKTLSAIREPLTEKQLADEYRKNILLCGGSGESFDSLICFGPNCAEPHHDTDDTPLRPGDSIILDVGLKYESYCSDMTRTVFFGRPTEEQKRVYDLVKAANAAGRAAVRPGVPLKEVDAAARKVIEDAGYGKYFIHRTGHGIGLEVHEFPDVSAASDAVCEPGMVFSVEPGIYLPGKFGVRVEDLVAVTDAGSMTLNRLDRELASV